MRVSRSGLVMGATYVVLAVASVVYGYGLTDPKASTVFMQVPVLPAIILLDVFGVAGWLADAPLVVVYGLLIPVIAIGLYALCWVFGALSFRTRLVIGLGSLLIASVFLFWPVRR